MRPCAALQASPSTTPHAVINNYSTISSESTIVLAHPQRSRMRESRRPTRTGTTSVVDSFLLRKMMWRLPFRCRGRVPNVSSNRNRPSSGSGPDTGSCTIFTCAKLFCGVVPMSVEVMDSASCVTDALLNAYAYCGKARWLARSCRSICISTNPPIPMIDTATSTHVNRKHALSPSCTHH